MNSPESISKNFRQEDMGEINEIMLQIGYFQRLYKQEIHDPKRTEASRLTMEIIQNLKRLHTDKLKAYAKSS